jgi:hypothetical protein
MRKALYNPRMPRLDAFQATFETLRALLKPYERHFVVIVDKPGKYYLSAKTSKTRSGAAIWFGGAEIKKNYVSLHLIPVYANPELLEGVSPSLLKRMQGKSCFNFTAIEPAHVKALRALTKKGVDGFRKQFR